MTRRHLPAALLVLLACAAVASAAEPATYTLPPDTLKKAEALYRTQIAMLLAAPAPVPAALLASDVALFEQGDRVALPGEPVSGGTAGNTGANHDDIDGRRELFIAGDASR